MPSPKTVEVYRIFPSDASTLCYDLTLNGYSVWYLPSKDELNKLYINRVAIGGFASYNYWSSAEYNNNGAWEQNFTNGSQYDYNKSDTYYVRAVRSFKQKQLMPEVYMLRAFLISIRYAIPVFRNKAPKKKKINL